MLQQPVFIVKTLKHINEGATTPEEMHSMVFCFSHFSPIFLINTMTYEHYHNVLEENFLSFF